MRNMLLTVVCLLVSGASLASAQSADFYVSPQGNDAWSGRLPTANATHTDGPFASLARARDAVRRLRAGQNPVKPTTVLLREGTYEVASPVVFGPGDSGTAAAPVTYAAYPGEHPVISGGRVIKGLKRGADGRYRVTIPQAKNHGWVFRQLWVNGKRYTLARSPNVGYYHIRGCAAPGVDPKTGKPVDRSKIAFRYAGDDIKPWPNLHDIDLWVFQIWETSLQPIEAVDAANHTVILTGETKWPYGWAGPDQRYIVENSPDALDAPGEWQLNRETGVLTIIPLGKEDLSKATVVAPVAQQLIVLKGDPDAGAYVDSLRFSGLSFAYTDWKLPPEGHGDWQAAVTVDATIQATGARNCSIERCEVAHIGNYAIWFDAGCVGNRIAHNEIHDLGAGGVRIGEAGMRPKGQEAWRTHDNVIENNFIHDGGYIHAGAHGVWVGQSSNNVISHNEICDFNYTGISVGWSWGYNPTDCHNNLIEYNDLHHLGRGVLSDMGAIYTLGISTGTVIRNNLIHDIWGYPHSGACGIYPDEGSSGITIENNVAYRTISGGLSIHYGQNLTVRNNIFALSRDRQVNRGRIDKDTNFTFEHNIICYKEGDLFGGSGKITADNNLYFNAAGDAPVFPDDKTFAEWQASGQDVHSIIADPKFADPAKGDFHLRAGSPATKIGFTPIDVSQCGLTGEASWVNLPKKIKRPQAVIPPKPVLKPQLIDDGFENDPVGITAANAVTWGATAAATIQITDETAASGKHSLKFTDAPGLDYSYNPHIWYTPHLTTGTARLNFDLRVEKGALPWVEWRTAGNPYHAGPSIHVDADGHLLTGDNTVCTIPFGQWIHIEMQAALGKEANGTWSLKVSIPGQKPVIAAKLSCDPKFNAIEWLGFVSNATEKTIFYIDNVKLALVK